MKRNSYADYLKGLLMLTVLAAHTWAALSQGLQIPHGCIPLLYVMGPWHMPLFMAVTGWFFAYSVRKRSFEELAGNKCRTILMPLVLWTILYQLCLQILDATGAPTDTLSTGSLWFLYSLLLCSLLMALCYHAARASRRPWMEYALALALAVWLNFTLKASYHVAYMFPFFLCGYACAHLRARPLPGWASCAVFAATMAFYVYVAVNGHFKGWSVWDSGTYVFGPQGWRRHLLLDGYRIFIGLAGSIGFAGVLYSAQNHAKARGWNIGHPWLSACSNWVREVGVWSLTVYAAQSVVVELLFRCGVNILYRWNGGNPFAGHIGLLKWVVVPIVTLALAAAVMALVRKLRGSHWICRALTGK